MTNHIKIIVEKHSDGYVAYPMDLKGVVVGEGNNYEKALADVKSAIQFHKETFGEEDIVSQSIDYLELKEALFGKKTVKELYEEIKKFK